MKHLHDFLPHKRVARFNSGRGLDNSAFSVPAGGKVVQLLSQGKRSTCPASRRCRSAAAAEFRLGDSGNVKHCRAEQDCTGPDHEFPSIHEIASR